MTSDNLRHVRESLDKQLNHIDSLNKRFIYQEAAGHLSLAEETFQCLQAAANPSSQIHRTILQNRRVRIENLAQDIENGLQRREDGKKEDGNIAFKCNWNDKGYNGICSDDAYIYNIKFGGPNCIWSDCRKYVGKNMVLVSSCYESRALKDFYFAAGWDFDEHGTMTRPRKIREARIGKIALLTTQPPNQGERLVVGAFEIVKLVDDPGKETEIFGDKITALDDMLGYQVNFWKYHKNPHNVNSTAWATGLFRYVSNVAVLGILEEYMSKKQRGGGDVSKVGQLIAALKSLQ